MTHTWLYDTSLALRHIPGLDVYCPVAHVTGTTSLEAQYMPLGHVVQLSAPSKEYCPDPHAAGAVVPPIATQLEPAGHRSQRTEPTALLKLPSGHAYKIHTKSVTNKITFSYLL